MKKAIIEFIGWYGVCAILVAYLLVSNSFISAASISYQLLNASGAFGIIINSITKKDFQPALLNSIWLIIAVIALAKIFFTS